MMSFEMEFGLTCIGEVVYAVELNFASLDTVELHSTSLQNLLPGMFMPLCWSFLDDGLEGGSASLALPNFVSLSRETSHGRTSCPFVGAGLLDISMVDFLVGSPSEAAVWPIMPP
ncbi:hypothetical protein COCNU_scaffold015135G000010 [Cocos nucifera]|nr:hypothetical protein [Cocos nucifera]